MVRSLRPGTIQSGGPVQLLRPICSMTLKQMSPQYQAAAQPLRQRLKYLRRALKTASDPEERWHIRREIAELTPILTQLNELADLTQHYYERGYWRDKKYTL